MKHTIFTYLLFCSFALSAQEKFDLKLELDSNKIYYRSIGLVYDKKTNNKSGSVILGEEESGLELSISGTKNTYINFRKFDLSHKLVNTTKDRYIFKPVFLDFEGGYKREKETISWLRKGDKTSGLNAFTKEGLELSVDKYGEIRSIENRRQMLKAIVKKTNFNLEQLEESISDEGLKLILGSYLNIYPEKAVSVGDKWENKVKDLWGDELKITFQLLSVNNQTYTIGLKSRTDEKRKVRSKNKLRTTTIGTVLGRIEITHDGWVKNGIIYERINLERISESYEGKTINPETNIHIVKETHIQGWSSDSQIAESFSN